MPDQKNYIGELVIVALKARDLPNREIVGKQDPFCTFRLGEVAKRTKTDYRGGQRPVWDDQVNMPVPPNKTTVFVQVFDEDSTREDLISEAEIDFTAALRDGEADGWFPLKYKGKAAGEIYLEFTFYSARPPPKRQPTRYSKPLRKPQYGNAQPAQHHQDYPNPQFPPSQQPPLPTPATSTAGQLNDPCPPVYVPPQATNQEMMATPHMPAVIPSATSADNASNAASYSYGNSAPHLAGHQQHGYPPSQQHGQQQGYPPSQHQGYPPSQQQNQQQGYPASQQSQGYPPSQQHGFSPSQQPNHQQGYPPSHQGHSMSQPQGYSPSQQSHSGYPPTQQQHGYSPSHQQGQHPSYPPSQPGHSMSPQQGYPPSQQHGYPPSQQQNQQQGYPPSQHSQGYPPSQQHGFSPSQQPNHQQGYPPSHQGHSMNQQQGYSPGQQQNQQQGYPSSHQQTFSPSQHQGYPMTPTPHTPYPPSSASLSSNVSGPLLSAPFKPATSMASPMTSPAYAAPYPPSHHLPAHQPYSHYPGSGGNVSGSTPHPFQSPPYPTTMGFPEPQPNLGEYTPHTTPAGLQFAVAQSPYPPQSMAARPPGAAHYGAGSPSGYPPQYR